MHIKTHLDNSLYLCQLTAVQLQLARNFFGRTVKSKNSQHNVEKSDDEDDDCGDVGDDVGRLVVLLVVYVEISDNNK